MAASLSKGKQLSSTKEEAMPTEVEDKPTKKKPAKKRYCLHPGCGALLSRYNTYDSCLRHPLPNGYLARDGRVLTPSGKCKKEA